ncbi:unnamed protein product, partial [Effrenium voratum]
FGNLTVLTDRERPCAAILAPGTPLEDPPVSRLRVRYPRQTPPWTPRVSQFHDDDDAADDNKHLQHEPHPQDLIAVLDKAYGKNKRDDDDDWTSAKGPVPGVKYRGGTPPNPPSWHYDKGDLRAYRKWQKRVEIWLLQVVNYIPRKEAGILLFNSLRGELEEELEDADVSRIYHPQGVEFILQTVQQAVEARSVHVKRKLLHDFESIGRYAQESMRSYCNRYRRAERALETLGIQVTSMYDSEARGSRLLDRSRLPSDAQRNVLIGTAQSLDFDKIKDVLLFQYPEHRPPAPTFSRDGPTHQQAPGGKGHGKFSGGKSNKGKHKGSTQHYGKGNHQTKGSYQTWVAETNHHYQDDEDLPQPPQLSDIEEAADEQPEDAEQVAYTIEDDDGGQDLDDFDDEAASIAQVLTVTAKKLSAITKGRRFTGNFAGKGSDGGKGAKTVHFVDHHFGYQAEEDDPDHDYYHPIETHQTDVTNIKHNPFEVFLADTTKLAGYMILDTACQCTCAGDAWVNVQRHKLDVMGISAIDVPRLETFEFGAGKPVVSITTVYFPSVLGDKLCLIGASVLPSRIPLLASRPLMTTLGTIIDLGRMEVTFTDIQVTVPLVMMNGHVAVGISEFAKQAKLASQWKSDSKQVTQDVQHGHRLTCRTDQPRPLAMPRVRPPPPQWLLRWRYLVMRATQWARQAQRFLKIPVPGTTSSSSSKSPSTASSVAHRENPNGSHNHNRDTRNTEDCQHLYIKRSGNPERMGGVHRSLAFLAVATTFLSNCVGQLMGGTAPPSADPVRTDTDYADLADHTGNNWRYDQGQGQGAERPQQQRLRLGERRRLTGRLNQIAEAYITEKKVYDNLPAQRGSCRVDIMELFAGRAEISEKAESYQLRACKPFDIIYGHDMRDPAQREFWRDTQRRLRPLLLVAGIECTAWSIFNENLNYAGKDRMGELIEIRKREMPMVNLAIEGAYTQIELGNFFLLENPAGSRVWELPELQALATRDDVYVVRGHSGAYGGTNLKNQLIKKTFQWMTNSEVLAKAVSRKLDAIQLQYCVPLQGPDVRARRSAPTRFLAVKEVFYQEPVRDSESWNDVIDKVTRVFNATPMRSLILPDDDPLYQQINRLVPWKLIRIQLTRCPIQRRLPRDIDYSHRGAAVRYMDNTVQIEAESLDGLHYPKQKFTKAAAYAVFWYGFGDNEQQAPAAQPPRQLAEQQPPEDLPLRQEPEVTFPSCPANITAETKSAVSRLHRNLGHPTEKELIRLLAWQGAISEHMVTAVKHLKCDSCMRTTRQQKPRPSAMPVANLGQFNDYLQADVFYCKDLSEVTHAVLGIVDQSTLLHQAIRLQDMTPETTKEAFRWTWIKPYGFPYNLRIDQGGNFGGEFRAFLERNGVLLDIIPAADFDEALEVTIHAINSFTYSHGRPAYMAVFGQIPRVPGGLLQDDRCLAYKPEQTDSFTRPEMLRAEAAKALAEINTSSALRFLSYDPDMRSAWLHVGTTTLQVAVEQLRAACGFEAWLLHRKTSRPSRTQHGTSKTTYGKITEQVLLHQMKTNLGTRQIEDAITCPTSGTRFNGVYTTTSITANSTTGGGLTATNTTTHSTTTISTNTGLMQHQTGELAIPLVDLTGGEPEQATSSTGQQLDEDNMGTEPPLPTLPAKRTHDAMLADSHGSLEPPPPGWDGSEDITSMLPRHSTVFSQAAAEYLQTQHHAVLVTDLMNNQHSEAEDDSSGDDQAPSRQKILNRKEAKALEREIPWRKIMTLPAADVQEYVKSAQKEGRGWQTWGSVEALTDQQADRIMKCPTMRKRILRSRACYRNKSRIPGKLVAKTRVVALGHLDPDLTTISRDSPTPTRTSEYVLLAIFTSGINKMVQNTKAKWLLWCGDVSTAFLQGQPDADERPDDLYLLPPQDGLARLAGIFRAKLYKEVTRRVLSVGYKQHALDKMMFYKHDSAGNLMCVVIVYVDDFLLTCVETYDKEELLSLFTWGSKTQLDLTTPIEFKGKEYTLVTDNSGYLLKVTQKKFINTTPAPRKITKREPDDPLNFEERADFKSVSGSLQWLSAQCRPDVSAWVSLCSKGSETTVKDLQALHETLNYAKSTPDDGLTFQNVPINDGTVVIGYADSSWANAHQGASQQGALVLLTSAHCTETSTKASLVDWRSHRSGRVCCSTLAAEASACDDCVDRAYFVALTLTELLHGVPAHRAEQRLRQLQVTDCKSLFDAVCTQNPRTTEKRTYVDIRSIQEFIDNRSIRWVPTELQFADGLTKCNKQLRQDFHEWLSRPFVKLTDKAEQLYREAHAGASAKLALRWVTPLAANPPAMYAVRVELPSGDVHYEAPHGTAADHPESAYVAEILQELAKRETGLCQLQLVLEDWPLVPSCALRSLAPPGDLVLKLWRDPFQLERATGAHGPGVRELNFGLCGAQPASKSRLLSRYCAGADFASGDLEYVTANFMLNGNPLKLHLWDQPAQYSEMLQAFLKGKDAFLRLGHISILCVPQTWAKKGC